MDSLWLFGGLWIFVIFRAIQKYGLKRQLLILDILHWNGFWYNDTNLKANFVTLYVCFYSSLKDFFAF